MDTLHGAQRKQISTMICSKDSSSATPGFNIELDTLLPKWKHPSSSWWWLCSDWMWASEWIWSLGPPLTQVGPPGGIPDSRMTHNQTIYNIKNNFWGLNLALGLFCLVWFHLVWFHFVWFRLVLFGFVWFRRLETRMARFWLTFGWSTSFSQISSLLIFCVLIFLCGFVNLFVWVC